MVSKFYVFSKDNKQHEYTITSKVRNDGNVVHALFYSEGEQWKEEVRGTRCLRIIEGNLEMEIVDQKKGMQPYSDIAELQLLLNFITRDYTKERFDIIEVKNKIVI